MAIQTSKAKLMLEANIARAIVKRVCTSAADLSKAIQVCQRTKIRFTNTKKN